MKNILLLSVGTMLIACSSVPDLKYPDGSARVPINGRRIALASTHAVASPDDGQRIRVNDPADSSAENVVAQVLPVKPESESESYAAMPLKNGPVEPISNAIGTQAPASAGLAAVATSNPATKPATDKAQVTLKVDSEPASLKYAVFFDYASRVLTPAGEDAMRALASDAARADRVEIIGRADSYGPKKNNEVLAKARGESVRKALLALGVKVKTIVVKSEVGDVDVSQDAKLNGVMPVNVAERSRRADVAIAVHVVKGAKELAENTKKSVDSASVVAIN